MTTRVDIPWRDDDSFTVFIREPDDGGPRIMAFGEIKREPGSTPRYGEWLWNVSVVKVESQPPDRDAVSAGGRAHSMEECKEKIEAKILCLVEAAKKFWADVEAST